MLGVVPGMEHVIGGTITRAIYPRPTNNLQLDFLNAMIRKTYDGVDFGLTQPPSFLKFWTPAVKCLEGLPYCSFRFC